MLKQTSAIKRRALSYLQNRRDRIKKAIVKYYKEATPEEIESLLDLLQDSIVTEQQGMRCFSHAFLKEVENDTQR